MKELLNKYDNRLKAFAENAFAHMNPIVAKIILGVAFFFIFGFLFCTERGGFICMYFGYAVLLAWLLYTAVKLWRFGTRAKRKSSRGTSSSSSGRHVQPSKRDWDLDLPFEDDEDE